MPKPRNLGRLRYFFGGVDMKRRDFVTKFAAASGVLLAGMKAFAQQTTTSGVVIERPRSGTPHAGKVLVAIQPHSDDIPLFAAGTVAKLIRERSEERRVGKEW